MPALTVRNLTEETHTALKARAARNNRSTEAEVRAILEAAVQPPRTIGLATMLAEMAQNAGLTDEDFDALVLERKPTTREPVDFS
jgi:plasmid stability protein